MKTLIATLMLLALGTGLSNSEEHAEHIDKLTEKRSKPVRLKDSGSITTQSSFKPPIEILVEAKTDSTNLRLSYAADQLIFNWERDRHQLRVDGGPANGRHKFGAGYIPENKYVKIRWVVTKDKQSIYVNEELRFEHSGDYGDIDKPVTVFTSRDAEVMVKSIKTKSLD
ncbi:hypothetical protein FEM03_13185 [Phragmitibacter flavus]|uniref:Uncharacterized protein n=1 Tax=Phragmitibacter flavus TaxID=2576071 RepID=A0A5R8KCV9_9BACT|nr:hypothetical protein [Phragmitibacter flavus]TLD70142.1 hypothetical protein FEM03_13185 [Phragmitibacter flavus]